MTGELRPVLERMSRETKETVDLAVLDGEAMLFVDQVTGPQRLRTVSAVGTRFPLVSTANGKAALALLPEIERARRLPSGLSPHLRRELARVAQDGFAEDIEEHTPGICAVGRALHGQDGQIYAISIPVPSARYAARRDALIASLDRAIEAIGG